MTSLLSRNFIYECVRIMNLFFGAKKPRIAIFCYHSISGDGWRFSVRAQEFKKQINHLIKTYTPIKASELPEYISEKEIEKNMFVLTFDDGYEDILSVKDFLREKGITPTIFLITDSRNANRAELETERPLLTREQIRELIAAGWEIGSHSRTHADFSNLKSSGIQKEVGDSKDMLERELGIKIKYFAYPKGFHSNEIVRAVEGAGYDLGFSMDDGYLDKGADKFLIPRVGVDGTHAFKQFKLIYSPSAMFIRGLIKKIIS